MDFFFAEFFFGTNLLQYQEFLKIQDTLGGVSATATIIVSGKNGFCGSVALTATSLPSGVTAAFSSASATTKSTLTITPGSDAVPGTYMVTVSGTSGTLKSGTNISLTIPVPPSDAYSADLLSAAVEAHHADYVYGNTFVNSAAGVPIHYATDHGSLENDRIGSLWFYNNTFYEPLCNGCPNWRWMLFDTSGGGGDDFLEIEWPQVQVHNNAIWMDSPTQPYFYWNNETNQFTTFGKNVINSNWGTGVMSGGDGTGWASRTSVYAFQGASNSADAAGVGSPGTELEFAL